MRFRIYISIDGNSFDAEYFNSKISDVISGDVVKRKYNRRSPESPPTSFWKTAEIVTSSTEPECELQRLLERVGSNLPLGNESSGIEITAEIVAEYDDGEEPRGFYFNAATIRMLGQLGAQLDIDAVPRLA